MWWAIGIIVLILTVFAIWYWGPSWVPGTIANAPLPGGI